MTKTLNVKVVGLGVDADVTINEGESVSVALTEAGVEIAKGIDIELNADDATLETIVTADPELVENEKVEADAVVSVATNIDGGIVLA